MPNISRIYDISLNGTFCCAEDEAARKDSRYHLKSVNAETSSILDELDRTYSAPVKHLYYFIFIVVVVVSGTLDLKPRILFPGNSGNLACQQVSSEN